VSDRWEEAWREMLADCWETQSSTGGWNGGDLVQALEARMQALGFDTTHPAERAGGPGEVGLYQRAELDRIAHGHPPNPRCVDCQDDDVSLDAAGRCPDCAADAEADAAVA
jgi:hypothetical protein